MADEAIKEQTESTSWYAMTPNRLLVTLGALRGEINCDVCVIGAGFTGISAAYELTRKGYSVTLLEAKSMVDAAPGKSGSHLLRGYHRSPAWLARKYGPAGAKMLCNMTLEGLALIAERIMQHDIKCDIKFGHFTAAGDGRAQALRRSVDEWAKLGHTDLKYVGKKDVQSYVSGKEYGGGLYDPKGAHFHPMNYALGVMQTAQMAGCKIYDETPVLSVTPGAATTQVKTKSGAVNARFVILSGYVRIPGIPRINTKVIGANMPMLATRPLEKRISHKILPRGMAVMDSKPIANYFHLSHDNRLLFGSIGRNVDLKKRMRALFPDMAGIAIDHAWESPMDFTANRMPHFGRVAGNIFYAQGYCGQGIILANLAGRLIAEAASGTAERFDVFAGIRHLTIPGNASFRQATLALCTGWHTLRDKLA